MPWIDHDHPAIVAQAALLRGPDATDTARRCFAFVRDEVRHAGDHRAEPTTCRASDVLRERQGWCFAKSHLLVALLRANGLRAGLCYQRLADGERHVLHGLVAAELPGHGWYRMDPRGNKPSVHAAFEPPVERLAFATSEPGERDVPGVHDEPLPEVVACLTRNPTWDGVLRALPDAP